MPLTRGPRCGSLPDYDGVARSAPYRGRVWVWRWGRHAEYESHECGSRGHRDGHVGRHSSPTALDWLGLYTPGAAIRPIWRGAIPPGRPVGMCRYDPGHDYPEGPTSCGSGATTASPAWPSVTLSRCSDRSCKPLRNFRCWESAGQTPGGEVAHLLSRVFGPNLTLILVANCLRWPAFLDLS